MISRILIIVLFFYCIEPSAQTKRAIVIGLGQQEDHSWGKINGDKDVPFVKEMLFNSGFDSQNIFTLINKNATKENIVLSFKRLINQCGVGDIVYIHFSGHGQRVTDIDGDEKDGWDESWIPYDAYKEYSSYDKGDKHLIDDEIYLYLTSLRKRIGNRGKILVVVDACHSGGSSFLSENFDFPPYSAFGNNITIRGLSKPFIIPHGISLRTSKESERWLILSACKSFQVNQELVHPHVGILSYALYILSKKGGISMDKVEDFIKRNKGPYPQTPLLAGEIDKYKISDILK